MLTPQHGEKNKREAVRKEKGIKMTAKELNLAARTSVCGSSNRRIGWSDGRGTDDV